ncbi:MAG: ATP-binding protein [Bdellovibrionota bacterium]
MKTKANKSPRKLRVVHGGKAVTVKGRTGATAKTAQPSILNVGATEESRSERSRYDVLLQNANDAILVVDLENHLVSDANRAALEMTGYLQEELVGNSIELLYPAKSHQMPQYSQPFGHDHLENRGFFEDVVLISKDGYLHYVSLSVRPLNLEGHRVAMCIIRDVGEKKAMERDLITKHTELRNAYVSLEKANAELKSMQETLVQSGKLAALGELAAGIAHELNQPLTAVKGFAQEAIALADKEQGSSTLKSFLDEVVQGAGKMERIISHLRNFTRKSTSDFEWIDVHGVIEESLIMLDKQLRSRGIEVTRNFEGDLPKVYCNPFQLEQVFINLATNARDAIEANRGVQGKILIRTRRDGDHMVEIQYEDNGCGMADYVKAKIFNPFFTTKEVGKGMGLGLSISYGILSRIHASIIVQSTMGKGSVFTIKLPVDYRKH